MDRAYVGMLQCGGCLGFVEKAFPCGLILRELGREELQRNGSLQPGVLGLVDDAHAAAAEVCEDPVVRDHLTNEGSHDSSFKWVHADKITQNKRIVKRELGERLAY